MSHARLRSCPPIRAFRQPGQRVAAVLAVAAIIDALLWWERGRAGRPPMPKRWPTPPPCRSPALRPACSPASFRNNRLLPLVLTEYPDVGAVLDRNDPASVARLNQKLELLANRTSTAVIYVIGRGRADDRGEQLAPADQLRRPGLLLPALFPGSAAQRLRGAVRTRHDQRPARAVHRPARDARRPHPRRHRHQGRIRGPGSGCWGTPAGAGPRHPTATMSSSSPAARTGASARCTSSIRQRSRGCAGRSNMAICRCSRSDSAFTSVPCRGRDRMMPPIAPPPFRPALEGGELRFPAAARAGAGQRQCQRAGAIIRRPGHRLAGALVSAAHAPSAPRCRRKRGPIWKGRWRCAPAS